MYKQVLSENKSMFDGIYKQGLLENRSMFGECIRRWYQKMYQCLGNALAGAISKRINVWEMYKQVLSEENLSMFGECISRCYQKTYQCFGNV